MNVTRLSFCQYNKQKRSEETHGLDLCGKKILLYKRSCIKTILGKLNLIIYMSEYFRILSQEFT